MKNSKALILLLFAVVVLHVSAHVPFLKPNQFVVLHNRLQIESSFTEQPFQADFAMDSPPYTLIDPSGNAHTLLPKAKTCAAVYLEPELTGNGTYRINAAQRKGPNYRGVETTEGKLYFSKDTLTRHGKKITMQYYSCADTYICKGEPTYQPQTLNKSVEIIPLTAPNSIQPNDSVLFKVYQDGIPVPNARVVVAYDNEQYVWLRHGDLYDVENERQSNVYANDAGVFTFVPQKAGLVLLFVTIHKQITDTHWESFNNTLTLEVRLP